MIWLTWRQHRLQLASALAGLCLIAALTVITGMQMRHSIAASPLPGCLGAGGQTEFIDIDHNCQQVASQVVDGYQYLMVVGTLLLFLPLLVGIFWGAPLVAREVELGTHRLTWTQGVTPARWTAAKLGLVGGVVLLLSVAYTLLVSWWMTPLNQLTGIRFQWQFFDLQGVAPVGHVMFAVALGIFAGTVTRRVLPAMAVTLVGFVGLRLLVELVARPRFLPPLERRFPVVGTSMPTQLYPDWVLSRAIYNADGVKISGYGNSTAVCEPGPAEAECSSHYPAGAYNLDVYHPADRFWLFQGIEAGIYVVLAAILLGLAVHWVRRRIA